MYDDLDGDVKVTKWGIGNEVRVVGGYYKSIKQSLIMYVS